MSVFALQSCRKPLWKATVTGTPYKTTPKAFTAVRNVPPVFKNNRSVSVSNTNAVKNGYSQYNCRTPADLFKKSLDRSRSLHKRSYSVKPLPPSNVKPQDVKETPTNKSYTQKSSKSSLVTDSTRKLVVRKSASCTRPTTIKNNETRGKINYERVARLSQPNYRRVLALKQRPIQTPVSASKFNGDDLVAMTHDSVRDELSEVSYSECSSSGFKPYKMPNTIKNMINGTNQVEHSEVDCFLEALIDRLAKLQDDTETIQTSRSSSRDSTKRSSSRSICSITRKKKTKSPCIFSGMDMKLQEWKKKREKSQSYPKPQTTSYGESHEQDLLLSRTPRKSLACGSTRLDVTPEKLAGDGIAKRIPALMDAKPGIELPIEPERCKSVTKLSKPTRKLDCKTAFLAQSAAVSLIAKEIINLTAKRSQTGSSCSNHQVWPRGSKPLIDFGLSSDSISARNANQSRLSFSSPLERIDEGHRLKLYRNNCPPSGGSSSNRFSKSRSSSTRPMTRHLDIATLFNVNRSSSSSSSSVKRYFDTPSQFGTADIVNFIEDKFSQKKH